MPQYTGNYQPQGSSAQGQQSAAYSGGYGNNYQQSYTQQRNAPYGQPQNSYNSGYAPAPAAAAGRRNSKGVLIAVIGAAIVLLLGVFIISRIVGKNPARDAFDKLCDMTSLGSESYLYARVLTEELLETDLATADPDEVNALFTECLQAWKAAETVSDRMVTMSEELSSNKGIKKIKGGSANKAVLFGATVHADGDEQAAAISATMTAEQSVTRCSYLGTQMRTDSRTGYQAVHDLQSIYNGRSTSVTAWESAVTATSSSFSTLVYISGDIDAEGGARSLHSLSATPKSGSVSIGGANIIADVGSTHSALVYGSGDGVTLNTDDLTDYTPDSDSSAVSVCLYPEDSSDQGVIFHEHSFFSWMIIGRAGGFTLARGTKDTDNATTPPQVTGGSTPTDGRTPQELNNVLNEIPGGYNSNPTRGPISTFRPPVNSDDITRTIRNIENDGSSNNGGNSTDSGETDTRPDLSLENITHALGEVGAGQGDITVSLAWDSHDDIDLHIINPDESHIYYCNKTAGGGTLDVDANAGTYMEPIPIENIYYPTPAAGHYKVYIRNYRDRTDNRSTHYKVKVTINGEERLFEGDIDTTGTEIVIVEFDYVGTQSGQNTTDTVPTSEGLTDLLNAAGAGQGDITISMAWNKWDDLDLHVIAPEDKHIYYGNKSAGGGVLDIDHNAGSERILDPIENIYFAAPQNGHYKVYINMYSDRSDDSASYLVRVTVGGQTQEFTGTIDGSGTNIDIVEFDYGGAANADTGTYGGHRYQYYENDMSWTQARSFCQSLGGHLATITSQGEQEFITGKWPGKNGWIGAYGDEHGYAWVTGETWGYTNWASSQPDNANGDEWFVHIWDGGYWNDLNNDDSTYHHHHGFFCEWDSQSDLNESVMDEALTQQSAQSGEITISLLWDSEDDLDLHVFTPDGSEIYYGNKEAGGGVLDVDANAFSSSLMPNPVENVYFESPEDGEYWVYVINYHDRTEGSATNYLVRLQVGDEVQTFNGVLTNEDESAEIVGFRYTAD